jgi:hypothetical protein
VSANDVTVVNGMGCVPNITIHTLDLGYSVEEEDVGPVKLAEVFSRLCPNLQHLHVMLKRGNRESWDLVRKQVHILPWK